jgi:erythromycin esterase-like protein
VELRRRAAEYAARDGRIAADEYFAAEQNARVVQDAETYYRAMFRGGAESWNVRDRHIAYSRHSPAATSVCSMTPGSRRFCFHSRHPR